MTIAVNQESRICVRLLRPTVNITDITHLGMMHPAHSTGLNPLFMVDAGTTPLPAGLWLRSVTVLKS